MVDPLWLRVHDDLIEILLVLEGLQQFDLDLAILTEALGLLNLVAQSDLHGGVSVIILVVHLLRLTLLSRLLDWDATHVVVLTNWSLAIHHLFLFCLYESIQNRVVASWHAFLDLLAFPGKLLILGVTDFLD